MKAVGCLLSLLGLVSVAQATFAADDIIVIIKDANKGIYEKTLPGAPEASYVLTDLWQGNTFFNNFNFFTAADPTHGYVTYVDYNTAQKNGLISTSANSIIMKADDTNVASGSGRMSVRIESYKTFNAGLFIIDLTHMPAGCGTWPAFWTCGPNWPNNGEIDIIEGVNKATVVTSTLHTSSGSQMSSESTSSFTGTWSTGANGQPATNCDVNAAGEYSNQGCGIIGAANTMGSPFNSGGGGVYSTQWDPSSGINMWFWPRGKIPADITNNAPNPAGWGLPYAKWTFGGNCPSSHFQNHQVIFDLTFCGDWAGSTFTSDCPGLGTCNQYVQYNPQQFTEAYWNVSYVKVFQLQ